MPAGRPATVRVDAHGGLGWYGRLGLGITGPGGCAHVGEHLGPLGVGEQACGGFLYLERGDGRIAGQGHECQGTGARRKEKML